MKRLMFALMIVCCIKMSMLIWKNVQDARNLYGNQMRVMVMSLGRKRTIKKVPQKILCYFPLTPRVQRLFLTKHITSEMR